MKRILAVAMFLVAATASLAAEQIVVYAAASVTDMMNEIIADYNKSNKTNIVASYAASGTLARQIVAGAPASIFISANSKWVDELEKSDLVTKGSRKDYLGNDLVLIANSQSKLSYKFDGKTTLVSLLKNGEKFVIGDPEYVPAGDYARSALKKLGQWDSLEKSLVLTDSVRVALAFVERNEAILGAVYGSDAAASKKVKVISTFPADSYEAIYYPIVMIEKNKNAEVEKFYKHLLSSDVKKIITKYGFEPLK